MTTNLNANAQEIAHGPEARSDDQQFDVFLSYSRKDEEFARKLEEALENYRLPKDVKTSLVSKNRLSVFRDKKDLVPTDGDYYKTIEGYLKKSGNLIVICSPNSRRSQYVNQEIAVFLESHEPRRIIPILLSGKPNNDSNATPEEHAFPEALCSALAMPLALDFTEFPQARGNINRGRYHDSWYTLLAKIFGAERAEIERVDARRQARRLAAVAAISVAVIAMLSVALVFAIISRQKAVKLEQEAVKQRDEARRLLYASDMNLAQSAYESGNVGLGRNLLESYLPGKRSSDEDLRGFEWYYLWRQYSSELATFDKTDDVAFSRDGARFATITSDALKIWDAVSLRETASVKLSQPQSIAVDSGSDPYQYSSIDFSPDGKTVAFDGIDKVMLLDVNSGSLRELPAPQKKQAPSEPQETDEPANRSYWDSVTGGTPRFSPDGKLFAVSYDCGLVAVYNARSLEEIVRLGDGPPASGCTSLVVFSPDGRVLAYGNGYSVKLWDTVARRDLGEPETDASLPDSVDQVEAVAFSRDGKILAIGDRSKQLVLWNISTRKVLARLKGHDEWILALAFSPDGKRILSGGLDQTVRLWDFSSYQGDGRVNGEKIKTFATLKGHTGWIRSINCSPTGRIIATVGSERTVKLWNQAAGRDFDTVEGDVVFSSPNLITKHVGEGSEASTNLFDLRGGEPAKFWTINGSITAILSPDGKTLATDSPGAFDEGASKVKLWDVNSRQELITLRAKTSDRSPAFSRNGGLFIAIGPDGTSLILWDAAERKELTPIRNDAELNDFLLSEDGKIVVTFDSLRTKLKSWDVVSQKQLAVIDRKRATGGAPGEESEQTLVFALSPDGKFLAVSDSKNVELWETGSTQAPVILGKHEMKVSALSFSPDGKLVAAGDTAGVVKVWDAVTRGERAAFKGHKDEVTALAFSPDGRTLASGGGATDRRVKLYSTVAMRELLTLTHEPSPTSETHALQGGEDTVLKVEFSADGRSLITLSGNNVVRIWRGAKDSGVVVNGQ
jgi:WD40 repeat protein